MKNIFLERAKAEGFKDLKNPLVLTAYRYLAEEKSIWSDLKENSIWDCLNQNDR